MLSAIWVGLLRFVGTWAGTFLLQTETTGQAVVALAPTRARLVPSDLLDGVDTLACCSPCPWACYSQRDLPGTGSSGILIAMCGPGLSRLPFLTARRLKGRLCAAGSCLSLARPAAASPGTPGAQQPTSVSARFSWPRCAAGPSTSGECSVSGCRTALAVGDAVGARILVGRSDESPGF